MAAGVGYGLMEPLSLCPSLQRDGSGVVVCSPQALVPHLQRLRPAVPGAKVQVGEPKTLRIVSPQQAKWPLQTRVNILFTSLWHPKCIASLHRDP